MRKVNYVFLAIIVLSFVIAVYSYPLMPEKVASHWNVEGEVDGYMDKFWGTFLMPIISVGMLLLFIVIPKIDPKKQNIEKFRKYYDWLIILIIIFLVYMQVLTTLANLGVQVDITKMLLPAMGILFFFIGSIMKNIKPNWFIGIRTPYTLSSDQVWKKTHSLGGKLFQITGIIIFLGVFIEGYFLLIIFVPIVVSVVYLFVYSYIEYNKIKKKPKK